MEVIEGKYSEIWLGCMFDDQEIKKASTTIFNALIRKANNELKEIEDALRNRLCIKNA